MLATRLLSRSVFHLVALYCISPVAVACPEGWKDDIAAAVAAVEAGAGGISSSGGSRITGHLIVAPQGLNGTVAVEVPLPSRHCHCHCATPDCSFDGQCDCCDDGCYGGGGVGVGLGAVVPPLPRPCDDPTLARLVEVLKGMPCMTCV